MLLKFQLRRLISRDILYKFYSFFLISISSTLHGLEFNADDTMISRNTWILGNGSDLLGAFSAMFYGLVPNLFFEWWQNLVLIQAFLAGIGLYLIFRSKVLTVSRGYLIIILLFNYLCINLAIAQTRDGIMISVTLLAIGLMINYSKILYVKILIVLLYLFAFSFRPWLSISLVGFIYLNLSKKLKLKSKIFLTIFLILAPFIIDKSIGSIAGIKPGFAQQTVMIHDLTTALCTSSNLKTRNLAYRALKQIETQHGSLIHLCNHWKPNTWQSSIDTISIDDPVHYNSVAPISVIVAGDTSGYKTLRNNWIHITLNDPKTYMQSKLYFLTQVLIAGEGQSIGFSEKKTVLNYSAISVNIINGIKIVYDFIWKSLINLHVISPMLIFILFFYFYIKKSELAHDHMSFQLLIILSIWVIITTIGFVSDNGRYTYLPCLTILTHWLRLYRPIKLEG